MGDKQNQPFQLSFNASLKVDFQGSRVTSDGGLILIREYRKFSANLKTRKARWGVLIPLRKPATTSQCEICIRTKRVATLLTFVEELYA